MAIGFGIFQSSALEFDTRQLGIDSSTGKFLRDRGTGALADGPDETADVVLGANLLFCSRVD